MSNLFKGKGYKTGTITMQGDSSSNIISTLDKNESHSLIDKIIKRNNSTNNKSFNLEEVVNVNRDIQVLNQEALQLLSPKVLYKSKTWTKDTSLYKHTREDFLEVNDTNKAIVPLMHHTAAQELINSGQNIMHIGLIVIGLKGMVRKETRYKVFIVVTDTRNKTNRMKGIIGTIEADMNQNKGIFYLSPYYFMSIKDFCKYYEIRILTKGLDNMEGETLALCVGFIG